MVDGASIDDSGIQGAADAGAAIRELADGLVRVDCAWLLDVVYFSSDAARAELARRYVISRPESVWVEH
jgi:hypothetical protein